MRSGRQAWFTGMCCLLAGLASAQGTEFSCQPSHATRVDGPAVIVTTLGGVPAVLRVPEKISKSPILLWHGFGPPDTEQALMAALPLDEVPAVKVYLGLPMFGARVLPGGFNELVRRQKEDVATLVFEPAVMGAAKELPAVLQALEQHHCLKRGEAIGLFGFSAGGAAVLYALAEADVPISTAVTLNASTGLTASVKAFERATKESYAWTDATRKLAQRSDAVSRAKDIAAGNPPPALQIIHGADDAMLTPQIASALRDALQPLYNDANAAQRLQLTVVPGMAHVWTDPGTVEALRGSIAAWFHTYLSAAGAPAAP
jgi:predicted esterase